MHTPAVCEAFLGGQPSMPSTPITRRGAECEASPPVAAISKGGSSKKRKVGEPGCQSSDGKSRKGKKKDASREPEGWIDEPDVCAFCDDGVENGEKLLCCDGPCMRSFHPTVWAGRQNKCQTLGLNNSVFYVDTWKCPNCEAGQHQCFACGKLGSSNPSTGSLQEVFVCASKQCRRFYHPACVAKLLIPEHKLLIPEHVVPGLLEREQKKLAFRIQSKSEPFICPLHNCASCNEAEDKTDPSLRLIKCRRCPSAWHAQCLPQKICDHQFWHLEGGKHVMYCGRHKLDPELLTPKRDHIQFPAPKPVEISPSPARGNKYVWTSTPSRLLTIDEIKAAMGIFATKEA